MTGQEFTPVTEENSTETKTSDDQDYDSTDVF